MQNIQIENEPSLYRDIESKAIMDSNTKKIIDYKRQVSGLYEIAQMKTEISRLHTELNEIKRLLIDLKEIKSNDYFNHCNI